MPAVRRARHPLHLLPARQARPKAEARARGRQRQRRRRRCADEGAARARRVVSRRYRNGGGGGGGGGGITVEIERPMTIGPLFAAGLLGAREQEYLRFYMSAYAGMLFVPADGTEGGGGAALQGSVLDLLRYYDTDNGGSSGSSDSGMMEVRARWQFCFEGGASPFS